MSKENPKIGAVWGVHEEKTLEQLRDVAVHAEKVALMADSHLDYVMSIGWRHNPGKPSLVSNIQLSHLLSGSAAHTTVVTHYVDADSEL